MRDNIKSLLNTIFFLLFLGFYSILFFFFFLRSEYVEPTLYVTTLIYISASTISYENYFEEKSMDAFELLRFIIITFLSFVTVLVCLSNNIPINYIIFVSKFMIIYFVSSYGYKLIVQIDKAEWYEFFIFLPFYLLFLFYTLYIYFYNYHFNRTVLLFMLVILLFDVFITAIIEKKYLYFLKNNHNIIIHTL